MPYPYVITTAANMQGSPWISHVWFRSGAIYYVLDDVANDHIEVWKSGDAGVTWAEQDSANHKQYGVIGFQVFRSGDVLHMTYVPFGGTTISVAPFNLATDTWGTVITGGPTPEIQTGVFQPYSTAKRFASVVLSDGTTIVSAYSKKKNIGGTDYTEVRMSKYTGSWGSDQTVFDPAADVIEMSYALQGMGLGATDRVHFVGCTLNWGTVHRTYRGTTMNTFRRDESSQRAISAPSWPAQPLMATMRNATYLCVPAIANFAAGATAYYRPAILTISDEDNPAAVREEVIAENARVPIGVDWMGITLAYDSTAQALYAIWSYNAGSSPFEVHRACTKGAGWSAPSTVITGTDLIETIGAGVDAGAMGLVIENSASDTPYDWPNYYQDSPSCSAADPCGSNVFYRIV
jgi:hypothetical protein